MGRTRSRARAGEARISATEAAKNFGDLVNRVRESGATFIVERAGTPVAQVGPVVNRWCTVADLVNALETSRPVHSTWGDEVERGVRAGNRPAVPANLWR